MKSPDLVQLRIFEKKEFRLESDGVAILEKNLLQSQTNHVYFENIPPKAREVTTNSKKFLVGAIFVTMFALISIPFAFAGKKNDDWVVGAFWCSFAVILWSGFAFSRKSIVLFVQNGTGLVLYRNKPSTGVVDTFVKRLFEARNSFLLKKYGKFSDEENLDNKLARLNFLRTQEVISEDEFESKREEFTKGSKKPVGPLGFTQ